MDTLAPDKRSELMRRVHRTDTRPEIAVRRLAHKLGLRFRLHRKGLPGSPDLVFVRQKTCVFVHGCFWHRHEGCRRASTPKSNVTYWTKKFSDNVERDSRVRKELEALGWKVLIIWECETTHLETLANRLRLELSSFTTDDEHPQR